MHDTGKPEGVRKLEAVFGPVIHSYTRADMLADGELVDVTYAARETGFKCPVALTRACWERVRWTEDDAKRSRAILQDERGRLHDVVWMAFVFGARPHRRNLLRLADEPARFRLILLPRPGHGRRKYQTLQIRLTPDDTGGPAFTIGMADEDLS